MHAIQHLAYVSSCLIQSGTEDFARQPDENTDEEDNVHIKLSGKYELEVTPEMIDKMETNQTIDVVWLTGKAKKTNSGKYKLKKELVQCLVRKIYDSTENITMIVGHTRAIVTSSITNERSIFILICAIMENHGMIGQWFILRKQIILGRLWKTITLPGY
jgi:hypothetical protein